MSLTTITSTDLVRLALDIRGADSEAVTRLFLAFDELNPDWGTIPLNPEELAIFNSLRETRDARVALEIFDAVVLPVRERLGLFRTDLDLAAREARGQESHGRPWSIPPAPWESR